MFTRTYFALFVGELGVPVAFFVTDRAAEEWAAAYWSHASIDIRRYELVWTGSHTDDRLRPNIFVGTEELPRH